MPVRSVIEALKGIYILKKRHEEQPSTVSQGNGTAYDAVEPG